MGGRLPIREDHQEDDRGETTKGYGNYSNSDRGTTMLGWRSWIRTMIIPRKVSSCIRLMVSHDIAQMNFILLA